MTTSTLTTAPVVEVSPERSVTLPAEVLGAFWPGDKLAIWTQGDTVMLKRISIPRISDILNAIPDDEEAPEEMINDIVHEVRRQMQAEKAHGRRN